MIKFIMEEKNSENNINKAEIEKMKFNTNFKINYNKSQDSENIHLIVSTTPDTQKIIKEFCVITLPEIEYAINGCKRKRYRAKEWLLNDLANSTRFGQNYGKEYLFDKEFIDTGKMELVFINTGNAMSFINECKERLDKCLSSIFIYKQLNVNVEYTITPLKIDDKNDSN
jgi:hypothetical protein